MQSRARRRKYQAAKSPFQRVEESPPRPFPPLCGENRVTIVSPNVGRIALDNFAVLRYGKPPAWRSGVPISGFTSRLPVNTSRFTTSTHSMKSSTLSAASLFLGLTWILSLTSVSGQTLAPTRKLPLTEPLEKYNMPPAPPRKIETSPRMISQFGVFTSFQANVDSNGNNILGDCANEPSISVDPTDGNKMMIGWRQFNSINSDFRQAGWGYTTDAGIHWTFPGVLQNNVFRSDPVTKSDEAGNFFYLSLQSTQAQSFFCDDLWRSTNGGQSFTEQSPDEAGHGGDKEWFTIDTTNGTGHGFLYQFWTGFFACDFGEFNRSIDSGVTWQ